MSDPVSQSRRRRLVANPTSMFLLKSIAVRDRETVARLMGCTRQNVGDLERSALWKIRCALGQWWHEYRYLD